MLRNVEETGAGIPIQALQMTHCIILVYVFEISSSFADPRILSPLAHLHPLHVNSTSLHIYLREEAHLLAASRPSNISSTMQTTRQSDHTFWVGPDTVCFTREMDNIMKASSCMRIVPQ